MAGVLRTTLSSLRERHDESRFRSIMRYVALAGAGIAAVTEALAYVSPEFPKDTLGFVVMTTAFLTAAAAAHAGVSRRWLALLSVLVFGVIGWYLARAIFKSGGLASPQRDALYLGLAGAQALITFSALEFAGVTAAMTAAFAITGSSMSGAPMSAFGVTFVYIAAFLVVSMIGIVGRTRLQRSEIAARSELEELNKSLAVQVERQVDRIQRATLLGRFLPREISDQVMAGVGQATLGHARREVTVLCAVPVGFLEGLTTLDADRVAPLVNEFVSAMAQLAHEHQGVIERFVGPRITVLFGAVQELGASESAQRATDMAGEMQKASNRLLRQWENDGVSTLPLRMAIGIAAGTAVVGTFGSERRVEYSALGEATVRAHHLAGIAIPGEVRFDEVARRRLDGKVRLVPSATVEFSPGKSAPTFVLAANSDSQSPPPGAPANSDPLDASIATFSAPALLETVPVSDTHASGQPVVFPRLAEGSLFDGRYRIESAIGHGGMAIVYRARHVSLGQLRALKLIAPTLVASGLAIEQLRDEADATARIHHRNVVRLHDFGRSLEGYYYLALDLVDGVSLSHMLKQDGPLDVDTAVVMAGEILAALQAAHELRIVHRDVKPANVLIDNATRYARVTDFGLAQPVGSSVDPSKPLIVGTPAYMSPEQCQGKPLDGRSDLYSFGVMLYEMLAGELPYGVGTAEQLMRAAVCEKPVPIHERRSSVPVELWPAIARCLQKEATERPRSASEVLKELVQWANGKSLAKRTWGGT